MKASQGSIYAAGPGVEAERVPLVQARVECGRVKARAAQQSVGGVHRRKGANQLARQAFALQPRPRPGGVDAAQVIAGMQLVRQLEVVEDAVDCLDDLHAYSTHPHRRATCSAHSSSLGKGGSGTLWCLPCSTPSIAQARAAVMCSEPPMSTVAQGVSSRISETPDSRWSRTGMPRCRLSIAGMPYPCTAGIRKRCA